MLTDTKSWTPYVFASALAISVLSIFIWNRRRKYERVGRVSKLFFYPVKSLKAVEVTKGKCTKFGFEVNGVLDRSFMVVDENGALVSQRQVPSLVLLSPHIDGNYLIISGPNVEALKVKIQKSPSPNDKKIHCRIHDDVIDGIYCGDEAAAWFESYTGMKGVLLVHFFHTESTRIYTKKDPFFKKLREKHPAAFQDFGAFHIVSQSSIDDLNSKLEETKVSVHNFRPNILIEDCKAFAEDSWEYMRVRNDAELQNLFPATRCLMTTNDVDLGILSKKEPLVTLRKYRILEDPEWIKKLGSIPCLGVTCAVLSSGEIEVGDDLFAVVGEMPKMKNKAT